jgi:hypothetical protein
MRPSSRRRPNSIDIGDAKAVVEMAMTDKGFSGEERDDREHRR